VQAIVADDSTGVCVRQWELGPETIEA